MSGRQTSWERPDLGDLIAHRSPEAMELNQRYLNRQLGRVVKTLGFDREWVHGRGEYLIDAAGEQFLDLYAGFGVFSLGRNHPFVRDQLISVMAAEPANLPQIGVTTLAGVLAEELVARAPDPIDACVLCSSGTEAVEASLKLARAATGRSRILFCDRGFHGLTNGSLSVNGNAEFRERFGELLPGCVAVPFGDVEALSRELAAGDVAAFIVEPIQGKGVYVAPEGYLAAASELCHAAGRAVDRRRSPDRTGTNRFVPLPRAVPRGGARHGDPEQGAVGWVRADRGDALLARRIRADV